MFDYLAVTQPTANWLLAHGALQDIGRHLLEIAELPQLRTTAVVAGPLRFAGSPSGTVLCLWNINYLMGTGIEPWGFIKLVAPMGLDDAPSILPEVLDRSVYVLNQRLQGLRLDDRVIHRPWHDNFHSCTAGRGDQAKQLSIVYAEGKMAGTDTVLNTFVSVGPGRDFQPLLAHAGAANARLPQLTADANGVIASLVRRPTLGISGLAHLASRGWARDMAAQAGAAAAVEAVPALEAEELETDQTYICSSWSYDQWVSASSPLTPAQRRILESDVLLKQPLRIAGAAGSGKTLLMQLLAIRRLRAAEAAAEQLRVLYVVHSTAMMDTIWAKFETLGAGRYLQSTAQQQLRVSTLFAHSQTELKLDKSAVIDPDAQETKAYQLLWIRAAIEEEFRNRDMSIESYPLLGQIRRNETLVPIFAEIMAAEIAVAIKGHGLTENKTKYVGSEVPLSRLHGVLKERERQLVFDIFHRYHRDVFETQGMLDSDDVALSLLGQLRTPLWNMKRRREGYDFVFVDETQLFNENERRALPLLTRGDKPYVPVILALDEAQELRGNVSAGFGVLGIEQIWDASLATIHRSTRAIIQLAFFVIQQTTDLFGPDFPDFTASTVSVIPDDHKLAVKPMLVSASPESKNLGRFVLRQARALRRRNMRQVGVVVHSEKYWDEIVRELSQEERSLQILTQRGTRIDPERPVIVVATPSTVGGQEFDAVVAVGLEQGLVPPRVEGHYGFAMSLEQQSLREIYLSFTRAKYQLIVVLSPEASPTPILQSALKNGLIERATTCA